MRYKTAQYLISNLKLTPYQMYYKVQMMFLKCDLQISNVETISFVALMPDLTNLVMLR